MTKNQKDVKKFMLGVKQNCPDYPTVPSEKDRILRVLLSLEEVFELAEASGVSVTDKNGNVISGTKELSFSISGDCDLVGVADATSDISYINDGTALTYGIDLEPILDIVHENNMKKLEKGTFNEDGKFVKPPDHPDPQPEIRSEIERQILIKKM